MGRLHSDMGVQLLENKALSWDIIRKSACVLTEITIRKSQGLPVGHDDPDSHGKREVLRTKFTTVGLHTKFVSLLRHLNPLMPRG